jgi:hypothetical protein
LFFPGGTPGTNRFVLAIIGRSIDNELWRAGPRKMDMPKLTDRERLAELEARQKKVAEEIETARRTLRGKYGSLVSEVAVETLTEREFRDILTHAIRAGGGAALAVLKPLPARPS